MFVFRFLYRVRWPIPPQIFRTDLLPTVQSKWIRFHCKLPQRRNKHIIPQSMTPPPHPTHPNKIVLGLYEKLRKPTVTFVRTLCLSFRPSVCLSACPSAWNNSAPTERIFMKLDIWVLFENLSRKIQVSIISERKTNIYFDHIKLNSSQIKKCFR